MIAFDSTDTIPDLPLVFIADGTFSPPKSPTNISYTPFFVLCFATNWLIHSPQAPSVKESNPSALDGHGHVPRLVWEKVDESFIGQYQVALCERNPTAKEVA